MSAWESVPEPGDRDWDAMTEPEREDYLADVYDEIAHHQAGGRFHDTDGHFAEYAGSPPCLALGHKPNPEDPDDWDVPGHSNGWDDELLCDATRYGVACTNCEGECSHEVAPPLWNLPGVRA